jgi:hypothetical protein
MNCRALEGSFELTTIPQFGASISNEPFNFIAGAALGLWTLMQPKDDPPFSATALTVGVIEVRPKNFMKKVGWL